MNISWIPSAVFALIFVAAIGLARWVSKPKPNPGAIKHLPLASTKKE